MLNAFVFECLILSILHLLDMVEKEKRENIKTTTLVGCSVGGLLALFLVVVMLNYSSVILCRAYIIILEANNNNNNNTSLYLSINII